MFDDVFYWNSENSTVKDIIKFAPHLFSPSGTPRKGDAVRKG